MWAVLRNVWREVELYVGMERMVDAGSAVASARV
jgi:hypothetical protein